MRALWIGALPALLVGAIPATAGSPPSTATDFFETKVRPLLVQRCLSCHSGAAARGGLDLDSRAGWQKGGASGPAIVPGSAANSLLLKAVRHDPGVPAMPPTGKLPDAEITILTEWIRRARSSRRPSGRHCRRPLRTLGAPAIDASHPSSSEADRLDPHSH
jgi:hypothetical protein